MSGPDFIPGGERLPTGDHLGLRDRARDRVDRLRAAIGVRNAAWLFLDLSGIGSASAAPAIRPSPAGVEPCITSSELSRFVYELLDAHDDTARIAREHDGDVFWDAHIDYLRALQRKGRELLALLDGPTTGPGR